MAGPNWVRGAAGWAKTHKGQAIGIGASVLVVLFFLFSGGEGPARVDQAPAEDDLFGAGALPEDVTTASALNSMQARMEQLSIDLGRQRERDAQLEQSLRDQVAMLSTQMETQERAHTEQLEAALEEAIALARQTERRTGEAEPADLPPPVPTLRILRPGDAPGATGQPVSAAPAPVPDAGGEEEEGWVRLPLGSTVTGELLTGAFATKARGDALPVLMQMRSAFTGPNDTEIPLEDCLLIGKATADISSVRARVEAVSMSCVLPDGTAFERPVKGYFTGEDGTLGVPGRWEFRSGRWLANLLSAMGTVAAGLYADVGIAQEIGGTNAILGGISTSDVTDRIQEFFLQRAEEILPVVWVESGTPVYVVMLEGLTIEGLLAEDYYPTAASVWD
ncbi:MAG: TraB/VirB10 family protein [Candidatus Tectomicrobia bacterium]|nr:TraB/VirB10 family protein [Candidatus Tectomicrobia bacterium]